MANSVFSAPVDILGIGNAIVDVLARTEDDFLIANQLAKGSMRLIDEVEAGIAALRRLPSLVRGLEHAAEQLGGHGLRLHPDSVEALAQAQTHRRLDLGLLWAAIAVLAVVPLLVHW